jgi:threonine/homoserine/homoserine lactone efflux protein
MLLVFLGIFTLFITKKVYENDRIMRISLVLCGILMILVGLFLIWSDLWRN